MSPPEFKAAYDQGRNAAAGGRPMTANPYAPTKTPHPLDPPPLPRDRLKAAMWLRGWRKGLEDRAAQR